MASYRQNRPVLFLKGLYNTLLQLVQVCSFSQGTIQHPSAISTRLFYFSRDYTTPSCNQYTPVLFFKGLCNTLLIISTGLFYFSRDHTTSSYNQYRPVLSLKGSYNTLLIISTRLFYFTESHATPFFQLVQAYSIS